MHDVIRLYKHVSSPKVLCYILIVCLQIYNQSYKLDILRLLPFTAKYDTRDIVLSFFIDLEHCWSLNDIHIVM